MPLHKGSSQKTFVKNLKIELEHGKPMKQSLAIAYAMKRKKKAHGGQITDNYQPSGKGETHPDLRDHEKESGFVRHAENDIKSNSMAMSEAKKDLNQKPVDEHDSLKDDLVDRIMKKMSPDFSAEARLSHGGQVANDTEPFEADFEDPNEFDDLVLRDDLKSTYGEDNNSGDETGSEEEDERRKDLVSRIMASRRKKDKNPSPA